MFGHGRAGDMDDGGASTLGRTGHANLADAIERRKAAKSGIDERHWPEKLLNEIKGREWQIFREDFSIATRGSPSPDFVLFR